ncbi:MAG: pentapeptide MXKDX repeat protein [Devosia sp.]
MTLHPRHTTTIVSAIALIAALATPASAQDAMSSTPMAGDAMSTDAMSADAMSADAMTPDAMAPDAMAPDAMAMDAMSPMADGMMMDDMAMANDMSNIGSAMMGEGRTIMVTIQNVLTGQPFSPSFFEARTPDSAPLFRLGEKASDALAAVAEGGNIGMFSVGAAMNKDSTLGDASLAIHTLPGQTRTFIIHVDAAHPLIDGVWMLGNTNDGFSGVSAVDAFSLTAPVTVDVLGYDAGSENNNEKKGFLGALGGGNERDLENGVITAHTGIRGDVDAPKEWSWDVNAPVAHVTFTPLN